MSDEDFGEDSWSESEDESSGVSSDEEEEFRRGAVDGSYQLELNANNINRRGSERSAIREPSP